jgi:hypothetical protein
MDVSYGEISLERMVRAVEKVRDRLLRATAALEEAGVPYAVVEGNAVAAWVSRVDEAAVRNTQDVDIAIRRVLMNSENPYVSPRIANTKRTNPVYGFLITALCGTLTGMAIVGILTFVWVVFST